MRKYTDTELILVMLRGSRLDVMDFIDLLP
jgi:hypothetical protein